MAKYATTLNGSAEATAAAWSFKLTDKDGKVLNASQTINLGATGVRNAYTSETINEGVIAPGTAGSFTIVLDASGSDVGVDYEVAIEDASKTELDSSVNTLPKDMVFSTKKIGVGNPGGALAALGIKGIIKYAGDENDMKETVIVYWEWPLEDTTNAEKNKEDTDLSGKNFKLNITATGTQVAPTEPAAL